MSDNFKSFFKQISVAFLALLFSVMVIAILKVIIPIGPSATKAEIDACKPCKEMLFMTDKYPVEWME